jgi:NAD(P)-dependent dehydrogenase (short-subunit alcohol dehydrogenase family)
MSGTVVVTGASTGIGRVTALQLARAGFDVLGAARRTPPRCGPPMAASSR